MSIAHIGAAVFFILTGGCLWIAERYRGGNLGRNAAKSALLFVVIGGVFLAADVPFLGAFMDPYHAKSKKPGKKKQGGGNVGNGAEMDEEPEEGGGGGGGNGVESAAEEDDKPKLLNAAAAAEVAASAKENDCGTPPEMVPVAPGSGRIGASTDDPAASAVEKPERDIRMWPGFQISRNEITYQQYKCFVDATQRPWRTCTDMPVPQKAAASGDRHVPATCLTWEDAKEYTTWLSRKTGKLYRLPTAMQWEYAARAGERDKAAGLAPDDPMVLARQIFNMGGGVAEYVSDCWINREKGGNGQQDDIDQAAQPEFCPQHIMKDGTAAEAPATRQPWSRRRALPGNASPGIGFRVIRPG